MNHFDFFVGSWDVANRRLAEPLTDSREWTEFPATSVCRQLMDGVGFTDEMWFGQSGSVGTTLGFYEADRQEWALYWVSGTDGRMQPPVRGVLKDDRGDFFGEDTHDGQPIKVRYRWRDIEAGSFTWEQAYSADEGRRWETNWTMKFTRSQMLPD